MVHTILQLWQGGVLHKMFIQFTLNCYQLIQTWSCLSSPRPSQFERKIKSKNISNQFWPILKYIVCFSVDGCPAPSYSANVISTLQRTIHLLRLVIMCSSLAQISICLLHKYNLIPVLKTFHQQTYLIIQGIYL